MPSLDFLHASVAFGVAAVAGVINSMAGGGTLLTFPTLIWLGLPSITANATSTVALVPGTAGSVWGYRKEMSTAEPRMLGLLAPSIVGGFVGAMLVRLTPAAMFDKLVPYLILFATLLFMSQEPIQRWLKTTDAKAHQSSKWFAEALVFQFFVGLYGGYFGAGIGILMLAAMGIMGLTDIHQMNGLKSLLGGTVNAIASLYFIWARMVYWPDVFIMVLGAIVGGYGGARLARRMGARAVRRIVIAVGLAIALSLFIKR